MTFADRLKTARRRLKCSQAALCLLIPGLPVRTLQEWEHGRQEPPAWAQTLVLWAIGERGASKANAESSQPADNR